MAFIIYNNAKRYTVGWYFWGCMEIFQFADYKAYSEYQGSFQTIVAC